MKKQTIMALSFTVLGSIMQLYARPEKGPSLFTVNIVNNTGDQNAKMYVLVKGINPTTKKQTFIKFSKELSAGVYADVAKALQPLDYCYDCDDLKDKKGMVTLHLPKLTAGRIYVSLNNKLTMPINDSLEISDPDPFNPQDPNLQFIYDKVEFNYLKDGTTSINLTAVDYFSLPFTIKQRRMVKEVEQEMTYGTSYSRQAIFDAIQTIFSESGNSSLWSQLIMRNPQGEISRVIAPGRGDTFSKYLTEYTEALWTYYKTHDLIIDCDELKKQIGSCIFTGRVNDKGIFEFKNQPLEASQSAVIVRIAKPKSSNDFFMIDGTFRPLPKSTQAVLAPKICTAWSVGLLPLPDKELLNDDYFAQQHDSHKFYTNNPLMPATGDNKPWYNLYAKAIHAINRDVCAWVNDSALGFDCTITSTDTYPVSLIIGPMTGTTSTVPIPVEPAPPAEASANTAAAPAPVPPAPAQAPAAEAPANPLPAPTPAPAQAPAPVPEAPAAPAPAAPEPTPAAAPAQPTPEPAAPAKPEHPHHHDNKHKKQN